jgi:hypothetical protein
MRKMPGERKKKAGRLKYFVNLLRDGAFDSPVWSKAFVGNDPEPWRADGQHTSTVLATCPDDQFPQDTYVTIFTYRLDNLSERGKLFDRFDNPASSRSNEDKLGMFKAGHEDLAHLDGKIVGKALRGIAYYYSTLVVKSINEVTFVPPARELGTYLDDITNRHFCLWLSQWQKAKHNSFLTKPGITAEIYSDWKTYPQLATKFWGEVITESNPDATDYTRDLATTLTDWCIRKPMKRPEKFREKSRLVWERWRRMKAESLLEDEYPNILPPITPSSAPEARL